MDNISKLINLFKKFPGVGNKSARRMVFYLLKKDDEELKAIAQDIASLREGIFTCSECGNVSSQDPCNICSDKLRDHETICIVEDLEDLVSFEQAKIYNGLYHVLNERVAPFDGEDLSPEGVKFLVSHIKRVKPKEVIIATNPKMEGDLTYYSLLDILKKARGLRKDMKITRLAFGLPVGGAIGYADRLTLHTALESRVEAEFGNGGF